jgi:hypothetical protein
LLSFKNVIPLWVYPLAYFKIVVALLRFFSSPKITLNRTKPKVQLGSSGHQEYIASLHNKHEGERCFIIANGPSLSKTDIKKLRDEVTIGCNGIYKQFDNWGFHTTYYMTADLNQAKIRSKELVAFKGPIKFAALHTASVLPLLNDFKYFYKAKHHESQYAYRPPVYPQFSSDFASIVYHGYTIAYSMLQFAFHLGFEEVVIVGLDHDYGSLVEHFPPGKLKINEENIDIVRKCHFDQSYYKVGDEIGVPYDKQQTQAYELAAKKFREHGRILLNASAETKLECIEKIDLDEYLASKE